MHIKWNTTYPNTAETTKLGAMRTQPSIPQFLHTNETSENLSNALETKDTVRFSDYTKSSGKSSKGCTIKPKEPHMVGELTAVLTATWAHQGSLKIKKNIIGKIIRLVIGKVFWPKEKLIRNPNFCPDVINWLCEPGNLHPLKILVSLLTSSCQ